MSVPTKCHVCGWRGIVPGGFYTALGDTWSSSGTSEQCRQCGGKGIVWATDATPPAQEGGRQWLNGLE